MTAKIEARNIEKRFGGVRALKRASVAIRAGAVHALVGENGAGKSTLGKIFAGVIQRDSGEILLDGQPIAPRGPSDALRRGIAMVAQELMLVPEMTLSENVFLGMEGHGRFGMFPPGTERLRFKELAADIGLDFSPDEKASRLRVADQQKLEIMRALARNADIIVMDEPTAALSTADSRRLIEIMDRLRRRGKTIIYVSHFLHDVLAIADDITVLRDGEVIRTMPAASETHDSLVEAMLGRPLELKFPTKSLLRRDAPEILRVEAIGGASAFRDISFSLKAGEILGLAGLVGSGRTEVARAVYGADALTSGHMFIDSKPYEPSSPRDAIRAGVAMLPESRKDQGLLLQQSIGANISLPHLSLFSRLGLLSQRRMRSQIADVMRRLGVKAENQDVIVGKLSGGNQQKVVLARWMLRPPRVLIADEPTRGIDVGAKSAIYEILTKLAAAGMGIIVISSEMEELLGLVHRAIVLRGGRRAAELSIDQLTEAGVTQAAFGARA